METSSCVWFHTNSLYAEGTVAMETRSRVCFIQIHYMLNVGLPWKLVHVRGFIQNQYVYVQGKVTMETRSCTWLYKIRM